MEYTDEERCEVAENLRNLDAYKIRYAEQFYEELNDTVMNSWDFHSFQDMAYRLADLIEPAPERTCRAEERYHDDDSSPWAYYVCSVCGENLCYREVADEDGEQDYEMLPYCAGCGAKVVK